MNKHIQDRIQIITYIQQEALVGEDSGEEQLFSSENTSVKVGIDIELDGYLSKLKVLLLSFHASANLLPTTPPPKEEKKVKEGC